MSSELPTAPDSLPKYIVEGIPKQSNESLRDLQAWIDQLIEYREAVSAEDIEADDGEEIEEVDESGGTTTVIKRVDCGKDACTKCPETKHGPYRYEVSRQGGKLVWDYKGPVEG
ncbi:hypothetical protein HLRTI_003105 [Halorhabdus tiamatea SARL4B]|uniref:DUF6788 domain-containing protein n=1 Tax=Halorhabdus tiamatea SARL4B TaxID=1033806 RepID=F7PLD4_9EURY|nr:hypothetical protein [Halorhabdus tiamatea]ERJ04930.1 hypothetical protein HLRTI_003105 [Halorhabdus tiamatea SARL4B]CCQ34986.1 conserved hypothetical protein [Halorhabdus tiamatea SARL4B]